MVPINPTFTHAGLALFPQSPTPGFQLTLTDIAIGSGKYDPTGDETALANELARFPVVAGGKASPTSIRVGITLKDQDPDGRPLNDQWIGEIGFYAGATLVAIWSRSDKYLFYKSAEYDVPIAYTLDVSALPADSVTVQVELGDAAMQSMIFAHEADLDPHPQYVTADELGAAVTDHEARNDPHPQYMTQAEVDALIMGRRAKRFFHTSL
jgi:hypothetical protein